MKYVVFVKPPMSICNHIYDYAHRFDHIRVSRPQIIHCTLMCIRANQEDEQPMVDVLGQIAFDSFTIKTEGELDLFGNCLVVKINPNRDLVDLHNRVVSSLRPFINWQETPTPKQEFVQNPQRLACYQMFGSPFFGALYTPHITAGKVDTKQFSRRQLKYEKFSVNSWTVTEFILVRREGKNWIPIATFKSTN